MHSLGPGGNGELLRQQESVTNAPPKYGRVQTFARGDAFTPGCTHDNTCLRACVGAHVHTLTNSCCVKHYLNTIRMHSLAAQFASLSLSRHFAMARQHFSKRAFHAQTQ